MAPPPTVRRDPSIERTTEYEEFMKNLSEFHELRGTTLEREPRVGARHVDLLRLYNTVVARGGYDKISAEKLAWRNLGMEFALGSSNLPALAFNLKSTYYKNLAAFEIKMVHNKEPPPREILEDLSARGGDLLTRTLENYRPRGSREQGSLGAGDDSENSERGTPKQEKGGSEEPGSGSGARASRGLRQAPPQRVLFNPDVSSSRQSRHGHANTSSPQPSSLGITSNYNYNSSNPNSASFTIANYEPKPLVPLTMRSVVTPGNNPLLFQRQKLSANPHLAKEDKASHIQKGVMLPGTGFRGPNIYMRSLMALRSGIPEEQAYALHHLVKISHEQGDKYRFESFPGLAEVLLEKTLEASSLFYDIRWKIKYSEDGSPNDTSTLDGMNGTPDILDRIKSLKQYAIDDDMETEDFSESLSRVNESALVLRNMAMLENNAKYLSEMAPVKDLLSILLNLPFSPTTVEIKHYALDIAEQLTRYYPLDAEDPLSISLINQVDSTDRGAILTSLRAISRISMNLGETSTLSGIPVHVLRQLCEWLLLDDEEFVHACLDFLYQYTGLTENVEKLLENIQPESLINQLVRLLQYGARPFPERTMIKPAIRGQAPERIPNLPDELVQQLFKYEEPERSSHWLRSCFEVDGGSLITQIELWQAYQARFQLHDQAAGRALFPAAEFIKNVSATFGDAKVKAEVITEPTQKFIIRGIRPRWRPVDPRGTIYLRCHWQVARPVLAMNGINGTNGSATPSIGKDKRVEDCATFYSSPEALWTHILKDHLSGHETAEGSWDLTSIASSGHYTCRWLQCHHFSPVSNPSFREIATHVKQHLPTPTKPASTPSSAKFPSFHQQPPPDPGSADAEFESTLFYDTPHDLRPWRDGTVIRDPKGLAFGAVLVLRNLARMVRKIEEEKGASGDREEMLDKLFGGTRKHLFWVMAHNRALKSQMADLIATIGG